MGVNHFLLPTSDEELAAILLKPEQIRELVAQRSRDVVVLSTDALAIIALTAQSDSDPLAFIRFGAPDNVCGWVGTHSDNGETEVDMGYGPASYYRNEFLIRVMTQLQPITPELFAANCDLDWLEDNHIYPKRWHDEGRREDLLESFGRYRNCVIDTAKSRSHLLVWCA